MFEKGVKGEESRPAWLTKSLVIFNKDLYCTKATENSVFPKKVLFRSIAPQILRITN